MDKEKNSDSGASKILYIGDDKHYLKNLISEFKLCFPGLVVDFSQKFESEQIKIQNLIIHIAELNPKLIYLDLTKFTSDYLHLARLVNRLNSTKDIFIIGLLDLNASVETIKESYMTGIKINHIKNSDMHAVAFHAGMLIHPDKIEGHGFVAPSVIDQIALYELAKVGKVQTGAIQIETNRSLKINTPLHVLSCWNTHLKIMPAKKMVVTNVWNEGLFYNFTHGATLEFTYVDPVISDEFDDPKVVEERQAKYEASVEESILKMKAWLEKNATTSLQKNTRVLVIDNSLSFYRDQLKTDKYPYMIRCQPYLTEHSQEITKLKPLIIAFQIDSEEDITKNKYKNINNTGELKKIIDAIKKIKYYEPYIIIFNCLTASKEIQTELNYEKVLTYRDSLYPDIALQMASLLEKKILGSSKKEEDQSVYLDKLNPASVIEFSIEAKLTKVSETDLFFTSNEEIYNYSIFRIELPVPMYITVVPEKKPTAGVYYALIHGIGETDKNQLRKFINSIFFREKEAAKKLDREEQEKIKIAALKKKEEEEKKLAEAKKAEENAEKATESKPENTTENTTEKDDNSSNS
jgi:hypothetical protein